MKKSAFTLVEMIVGITISILLMTSIWVFVSSGMSNITLQKKVLDDNKQVSSDFLQLHALIWNSTSEISTSASWVLLKINPDFDKWGYSYIWLKEIDKAYCHTWETTKTNHLFVSSFIPFEEIWEDMNKNNSFSGILNSEVNVWVDIFKSDVEAHQILKKNWTDWDVVIWRDIFGDKMSEGSLWTGVFLNSPTGIVWVDWKVIFSDTLNNRILYLSGGLVYTLLDEKDWLQEPTWLAYSGGTLYISNSAKWEILELSSPEYLITNPELKINFSPDSNITNINKLKISVFTWTINLTKPDVNSDFTFSSNITNNPAFDFVNTLNNEISYYFVNNYINNQARWECSWNSWNIVLDWLDTPIDCNLDWTWSIANYTTNNFSSWTSYEIQIWDWKIVDILSNNQNYYVNLKLLEGNSIKYEKNFPYFTQGDGDIFTGKDNILRIFTWSLDYPTGLEINGAWKLEVNIFETRKKTVFNLDWIIYSNTDLTAFSNAAFNNYEVDSILSNPIKSLEVNSPASLLNIKLQYYKYLNCFNLDEKVEKTYLFKKSF